MRRVIRNESGNPNVHVQDVCAAPWPWREDLDQLVSTSLPADGNHQILPLLNQACPELQQLGNLILEQLSHAPGYIILDGLPFLDREAKQRDSLLLALAETLGTPSATGGRNERLIWEVSPRTDLPSDYAPSLTERNGPADFHTDSQYRSRPEDYVILAVVRPAESGGETLLMHVDNLLDLLTSQAAGRAAYDVLRQASLPFAVPMAFRVDPHLPEYVTAPVFSEVPAVRYRHDTLVEGFALAPSLATREAVWAIDYLRGVIQNSTSRLTVEALTAGEIIVINNYRVLHGRTDFMDPGRLLLRVRIASDRR